jgi:class 3 adenylate cyclase
MKEDSMTQAVGIAVVDPEELRRRISEKYRDVATNPEMGFHFHTGAPLARMLGYPESAQACPPGRSNLSRAPATLFSSATSSRARWSSMSGAGPASTR